MHEGRDGEGRDIKDIGLGVKGIVRERYMLRDGQAVEVVVAVCC